MNKAVRPEEFESAADKRMTDLLIERAIAIAPAIRKRSREAESLRRMPDATMAEVDSAQFLEALVPKKWGGLGLGIRSLCEVARTLAHGDASTAWVVAFLMEHNWMACYFNMELQERLYADRNSIKAAAPLQPGGTAVRVPGGYKVNGTFRYASCVMNSDWTFGTAILEDGEERSLQTFLIPLKDVTVKDEWFFAGMAATGSTNVEAKDLFVPEEFSIPTAQLHSAGQHPGAAHKESLYRYPILPSLYAMMSAIALGCGEATVELGRAKLHSTAPWGVKRIDRENSRVRWLEAHQKVRLAQLVYRDMMQTVVRKGERQEEWSLEETGQFEFDRITVAHLCKDAVRMIADGAGSSAFHLDDPLQRYLRDIDVIANHIGVDYDVGAERDARWMLGLGRKDTDPHSPPKKAADASGKDAPAGRTENVEAVS